MVFGVVSMVAFNLVDTYFVGRLGTLELAAMSFTFPIVFVINGLSLGLGVGASAVISRAIGSGDQRRVRRLTSDSLLLSLIIVAIVAAAGLLTIDPVFHLLGASDAVLPKIREYMTIWYLGSVFVVVPMVGNNAIRATGDTRTASAIMMVAVIVNVVMDPLLIFGIGPFPRMELAGAAIATVIARATTFVVSVTVLAFRKNMITLRLPTLRELVGNFRLILSIGIPTAAARVVVPIGNGVITRLVSSYGAASVAALGVSQRVEFFAMAVVMALATIVGPFVGQNWGARRIERVWHGVGVSQRFALLWGLGMYGILAVLAPYVGRVFNPSPEVIGGVALYLRLVALGYGGFGVTLISASALNVLNRPVQASVLGVGQVFALYIPLAVLGSHWFGLAGIFGAGAVSFIVTAVIAWFWMRSMVRREAHKLVAPAPKGTTDSPDPAPIEE
jgi:putative MATE family efflux protein